ncbi:MAG: Holliday junction resolvase RuvX [Tannerellaceae bacterium]|jgi:putative Holliday junction resolvase|nr:Holliday junction resolvase RuvX [Tannerellaceae bacterium]
MGRIIAVDYGRKRTGLAVTDPQRIIATELATVSGGEVVPFLRGYIGRENVDLFVVGLPKKMNGQPSECMQGIEVFVVGLRRAIPNIPVCYYDERFTSLLAKRAIFEAGIKKKKRREKGLIDRTAAVIILQDYLESLKLRT